MHLNIVIKMYYNPFIDETKLFNYACKNGHLDMVKLLSQTQDSYRVWLYNGLKLASINGHLDVAKFVLHLSLTDEYIGNNCGNRCIYDSIITHIFTTGHLEVIEWLFCEIPKMYDVNNIYINYKYEEYILFKLDGFYNACTNGHLNLIKWCMQRLQITTTILTDSQCCDIFKNTCINGHLNVAKWLYNNYLLQINTYNVYEITELFKDICINGKLEVAQWLYSIYPNINIQSDNNYIFNSVCKNGNLEIAQWLYSMCLDFDEKDFVNLFDLTCASGYLNTSKWLIQLSPNCANGDTTSLFHNVCRYGNFECIKWVYQLKNNVHISTTNDLAMRIACSSGNFDLVKWLYHLKPNMDLSFEYNKLFWNACRNGHLNIAQWIYNIDPNINFTTNSNKKAIYCTFITYKLELIKFLISINPDIIYFPEYEEAFETACNSNNILIAILLHQLRPNISSTNLFVNCCIHNRCELAKLIYNANTHIITNEEISVATLSAFESGFYNILDWLYPIYKTRVNICTTQKYNKFLKYACIEGNLNMVKWLCNNISSLSIFNEKYTNQYYKKHCEMEGACIHRQIHVIKWLNALQPSLYNIIIPNIYTLTRKHYLPIKFIILKKINICQLIDINDAIECVICLNVSEVISICKHQYCINCISTWLNYNSSCPYCRNELTENSFFGIKTKN